MAVTNNKIKKYIINKRFLETGDSIIENGIYSDADDVRRHQRGMISYLLAKEPFCIIHQNTAQDAAYNSDGHNIANGGWYTQEMLENFQADGLAKKCGLVRISGGTNDINNGVPWEGAAANLQQKALTAMEQGSLVFLDTVRPRSDYASRVLGGDSKDWTGDTKAQMLLLNEWIRGFCAKYDRIILMDVYNVHNDGSGDMKDANTYDGLHINGIGAEAEADLYISKLKELGIIDTNNYGYIQPSAYDADDNAYGNLLGTSDFSASGGSTGSGVTGTVPSGWTANSTDGAADTATFSLADEVGLDGETWPTVTIALSLDGQGADESTTYRMYTGTISTGVANATQYEFYTEFELSSTVGVRSVQCRLIDKATGGVESNHFAGSYTYEDEPTSEQVNLPTSLRGVLYPNPITTAGTTGLQVLIYLQVDETVENEVTLKLRKPTLRANPTNRLMT